MGRKLLKPQPQNIDQETAGQRIALVRKQKGLTQVQLATLLGVARTQITDIETGRMHMNEDMILRFARTLEISADYIVGLQPMAQTQTPVLALRFARRLKKIESLPLDKQKHILHSIDTNLKIAEPTYSSVESDETSDSNSL